MASGGGLPLVRRKFAKFFQPMIPKSSPSIGLITDFKTLAPSAVKSVPDPYLTLPGCVRVLDTFFRHFDQSGGGGRVYVDH